MNVDGVRYRTIWVADDSRTVEAIDQTQLPHRFEVIRMTGVKDAAHAIRTMQVRGAPLIGAAAAYGLALAMSEDPSDSNLEDAVHELRDTRPTAVNLSWALDRVRRRLAGVHPRKRADCAYGIAAEICDEDVLRNEALGRNGLALLRSLAEAAPHRDRLNVLTHCNAGWLATVDWGTATAPLYQASDAGMPIHVWIGETRPRLQGARLTAWELGHHGVPHTVVSDGMAGHLLRTGQVDVVLVGTDRTTATGDVANKIGTYMLALAASDNGVPFYVAVPSSSIDWNSEGADSIPIEQRAPEEVTHVVGLAADGSVARVRVVPSGTTAKNFAFDVTPARLVTGLITERGVCEASRTGLAMRFPAEAGRSSLAPSPEPDDTPRV